MTDRNPRNEELQRLAKTLRSAIPPTGAAEPQRDLWPRMLQRIEAAPLASSHSSLLQWIPRVPWFDWALLGVAGAALIFVPALIPALLYHL
jgi:hypothetical protein